MAGSCRYSLSLVMASLVVVAMVAASSTTKTVAAAAAEGPAACFTEGELRTVVEAIQTDSDFKLTVICLNTVPRVRKRGSACFCELRSRVQASFARNVDALLCSDKEELSRCPPTCGVTEGDVGNVAEAIRTKSGFKQEVVCGNSVRRARAMGAACLCELRSRVQARFDFDIDSFLLCGEDEDALSRCPKADFCVKGVNCPEQ